MAGVAEGDWACYRFNKCEPQVMAAFPGVGVIAAFGVWLMGFHPLTAQHFDRYASG
jgi:hypothetical protein